MVKMIKTKDYSILATLVKKYGFAEIKESIKVIDKTDSKSNDWLYTWSKTNLKRNDFWILSTIQSSYSYRQMTNAIESIERNR